MNLFAATEAVGDDELVWFCFSHTRKQNSFAALHGDFVVLAFFESERAGHAATAGIQNLEIQPDALEDLFLRRDSKRAPVVAMDVDERVLTQAGQAVIFCGFFG